MADTQRLISEILALLDDNQTGDITPQDLRYVVETMRHDHGELSLTATALTNITTVNVWQKAEMTTALSPNTQHNFDDDSGTNNRLRYTGTADRWMHIAVSISMFGASNSQEFEWMVVKNGDSADANSLASVIRRKIVIASEVGATALHAFLPMSTNDYIELWVRNITSNADITVATCNFVAIGMAANVAHP